MPRKPNTAERRSQIVAALLAEIAVQGYARASVQAIARRAGLAPGLVHYHFRDKEEILLELIASLARVARAREAALAAAATTPQERLQAWLDARLASGPGAAPDAVAAWVMIGAEAVRQPEVGRAYRAVLNEELAALTGCLQACLAARAKATAQAPRLAAGLLAFMEGAFQLSSAARELVPEGFAAGMAMQFALRCIDAEPPAGRPAREDAV
ncbi:TetR family transcriptional regulator [uncultured Massilia sp.]|uniref:TetR family transcriptional regulator n=1 Tax=uncultured Massilia sp. TaxID=169973 RepID=UPI0025CBF797|nr:TetR family transcriptional regulator [uncultured Massilia sp.]